MYLAALDQLAPPCQADAIGADAELSFARCDAAGSFRLLSATPFVPAASQDGPSPNEAHARAGAIALRMIDLAGDCPNANLGNEADLCEQFDTSRSLVRQALRILQDLDLIHVRRGRGGGHVFKQPSPIGIIRQVFAWLAARNCDPFALNALMWDFNSANLRLAGERLAAMPAPQRDRHCDHLESVLAQAEGHARFIGLQQALAKIADCPAIDTFARCVVSYQARSYGDLPEGGRDPRLQAMESAIVEALRRCDIDQAERTLRRLQDDAESSVLEQLGLRAAAE
jgi:DNA-binding FadR family transcriptional regulator